MYVMLAVLGIVYLGAVWPAKANVRILLEMLISFAFTPPARQVIRARGPESMITLAKMLFV